MTQILLFLLLVLATNMPSFAEKSETEKTTEPKFEITHFMPKDLSREIYMAEIRYFKDEDRNRIIRKRKVLDNDGKPTKAKNEKGEILKDEKGNDLYEEEEYFALEFRIGGYRLLPVKQTSFGDLDSNIISIEFRGQEPVLLKESLLEMIDVGKNNSNRPIASRKIILPSRNSEKDKQPYITKVIPAGGTLGDAITLQGYNLGDNLDNIYIVFLEIKPNADDSYGKKEILYHKPFYVSRTDKLDPKTGKPFDEIKFDIPHNLQVYVNQYVPFTLWEQIFGKKFHLYLLSNFRPSPIVSITLLSSNWKLFAAGLSLLFTTLFVLSILLMTKKWNFIHSILIDKETNTYKLSNFQAFAWTITFMLCYAYIALAKGLILRDGELPDFNFSLFSLMIISYGGYISSNVIDKTRKKKKSKHTEPKFSDLFSREDNDSIDISKLQLLGFTILTIFIYLFYLFTGNSLSGLPDVPPALQTLLLGSQGGFLTASVTNTDKKEDENTSTDTESTQPKQKGKR